MARNKKNILLVDNDASTRDLLARTLEEANYRALHADGGEGALRLVQEHAIDVAFVGLSGNAADDWETVTLLKESQPQLPFIVAANSAERFDHPLATDAEALLEKPIDVELFLETLQDITATPPGLSEKRNLWSLFFPMPAAK